MDTDREEIPIHTNLDIDEPLLDEASEEHILEDSLVSEDVEVSSELSEDYGSLNALPERDEIETSYDIGDFIIILLKDKGKPFLGKITEILPQQNLLKLVDEDEREFSFLFEGGEILMNTDSYEILDMIKVMPHDPLEEESEEYVEIDFESEVLLDKIYSDLAKSDDLLSALIHSMNIYDNDYKIKSVQQTLDVLIQMINYKEIHKNTIPSYMIPIIDDSLKLYDKKMLETELTDEINNLTNITSYKEYINNNIKYSKPIENTNGYGLNTEEYSDTYLRNCLQDDNCFGPNGAYTYDERKNNKVIKSSEESIILPNRLRIIGLLEEPFNEFIYSVNMNTLDRFSVFEKYIYDNLNSSLNMYKKEKIKESNIVNSDNEERSSDKYLLHSLVENDYGEININKVDLYNELGSLLLSDELRDKLYNYDDIEKALFKYDISLRDLSLGDREKLNDKLKDNIKSYKSKKYYYKRDESDLDFKKESIDDEKRVKLSYDLIFSMKKRDERNEYLKRFIDLFTRSSEKEYEDSNYLYNKYNDKKLLCKHYLYECNISNDNDIFNTMKSIYGLPPKDGIISCRVCGCSLCNEDTTLFDGYEGDKPMSTREVLTTEGEEDLIRSETFDKYEKYVKIIDDLSDSMGIDLRDDDKYEILLSFELLENDILSDKRYGMMNVSKTDIHPRVQSKIKTIKSLEKKEKDKKKKKEYKTQRENVVYEFQRWLKNTNILLMLTALLLLIVQTSVPTYFTNSKRSYIVLDIEDKKINNGVINYICAKLKRLCEKYNTEEIWSDSLDLYNEKEYNTNSVEIQLGLIIQYLLNPNFPRIVKRVSKLEDYIYSKSAKYLKKEWTTFKPLSNNLAVLDTNRFLEGISERDIQYYRKIYGGFTIENSSFIRGKSISFKEDISKGLNIPEIEIYKSNPFKVLLRTVVSLYGKRDNNLFISMTIDKLIEDSGMSEDILKIFTKHGKSDKLDIHKLRTKIIPDLLALYGSKDNKIASCYSDYRSCNEYIHNLVNNYDLPLLNTKPKRIYFYKPPIIYPELPFGRLSEQKEYDLDGNEIPNSIQRLFMIYVQDELNNIVKRYEDLSYHRFYPNLALIEHPRVEKIKFKSFDTNEENFNKILEDLRKEHSLPFHSIYKPRNEYDTDIINNLILMNRLENRFKGYLEKHDNSKLYDIFQHIITYPEKKISDKLDIDTKSEFSGLVMKTDEYIENICKFLTTSDKITSEQKRRFIGIFKDFNTGRILFNNENLNNIFGLFIKDTNLKYKHLYGYLSDIRNILSRLRNKNEYKITLPKSWKCSDGVLNEYNTFMDRDNSEVYLYLHNNIFMKTKDRYTGFNVYKQRDEYLLYFQYLSDKLLPLFEDLDLLKGSDSMKYNHRYSDIYMKYHFIKLLNTVVETIRSLIESRTDVTEDANDLFQSLEMRDEDSIDDMIEVYSMFFMDLCTHIMFQHYDPSWLFLNEQKLDLANRLSKQKEREKQIIIDSLDNASREERLAIMEKNKMGISLFYKIGSAKAGEYVNSDEYNTQTESERSERLNEIYKDANLELEVLTGETSDIMDTHGPSGEVDEEGGYDYDEEYDHEDTTYGDEGLDDEQEMIFNE
jgi:hypothetical protein